MAKKVVKSNCSFGEIVELWDSHWVDVHIKREVMHLDKLFQEFINATDERLAVNSTVKIFYNPMNGTPARYIVNLEEEMSRQRTESVVFS